MFLPQRHAGPFKPILCLGVNKQIVGGGGVVVGGGGGSYQRGCMYIVLGVRRSITIVE